MLGGGRALIRAQKAASICRVGPRLAKLTAGSEEEKAAARAEIEPPGLRLLGRLEVCLGVGRPEIIILIFFHRKTMIITVIAKRMIIITITVLIICI